MVFEFSKCAIVGFTRNNGKLPCPSLQAGRYTIELVPAYKYLGITLDNELRYKHQLSRSLEKGTAWANTIRISPKHLQMHIGGGTLSRLVHVQRQASKSVGGDRAN